MKFAEAVVATLRFNAKMDLANLECNLQTRDSFYYSVGIRQYVGVLKDTRVHLCELSDDS